MKGFLTLVIFATTTFILNAQTSQSAGNQNANQQSGSAIQHETLQKANNDVVVPKRVVQAATREKKTLALTDIQKIQIAKMQEQAENNKMRRESEAPQDLRTIEQLKQPKSHEQSESKPK